MLLVQINPIRRDALPTTSAQIMDRINEVIFRPRPFIRSATYFGPCRRRRTPPNRPKETPMAEAFIVAAAQYPVERLADWAHYAAKLERWLAEAADRGAKIGSLDNRNLRNAFPIWSAMMAYRLRYMKRRAATGAPTT